MPDFCFISSFHYSICNLCPCPNTESTRGKWNRDKFCFPNVYIIMTFDMCLYFGVLNFMLLIFANCL